MIALAPEVALHSWVALGDSLTAGHGQGERTWVDQVCARLCRSGWDAEVHNLAVAGARAEDVARDQLPAALTARPDLVTLFCGGNDVLLSVRPDLSSFAAAYDGIAGRIRAELPEARVLVATYPELAHMLPLRERARERVARGFKGVNAVIRGAARRHGCALLDFARLVESSDGSIFADDGVHPSAAGHALAARAFGDAIEKLLNER
jgi:lysophospholipase L1-like esterase